MIFFLKKKNSNKLTLCMDTSQGYESLEVYQFSMKDIRLLLLLFVWGKL